MNRTLRHGILSASLIFLGGPLLAMGNIPEGESQDFEASRKERMIQETIEARGVKDSTVLAALRKVERHQFVPANFANEAYDDHPLPIGHGQTISQPYIVAMMTEALNLKPHDKVLEIGTGSGYQAAILAEIVEEVYSIEIVEALAHESAALLKNLGYSNVTVKHGDGYQGWVEHAPFDAIIVTAAPSNLPKKLVEQLNPDGGRMIVPVGDFYQELKLITKQGEKIKTQALIPVRFVPMVHGKTSE